MKHLQIVIKNILGKRPDFDLANVHIVYPPPFLWRHAPKFRWLDAPGPDRYPVPLGNFTSDIGERSGVVAVSVIFFFGMTWGEAP